MEIITNIVLLIFGSFFIYWGILAIKYKKTYNAFRRVFPDTPIDDKFLATLTGVIYLIFGSYVFWLFLTFNFPLLFT